MAQPNPNDTKIEQQRSDAAKAALKEQTRNNNIVDDKDAADNVEKNKQED